MAHEDGDAVGVHITNFEDLVFRTEETEPEHFSFETLIFEPGQAGGSVGTGGQPGQQQILSLDPLRKDASIVPLDFPIALCDSAQQASRPWNTIGGLLLPDGALILAGQSVSLEGTGPAWISCQSATRVTIIINRRGS
jgi:hypothetical protein